MVIGDLSGLTGPTCGVVALPHRLAWGPERTFDLDDPWDRQHLYEIVLREAVTPTELATWLDGPTLQRLWTTLYLPRGVRQHWEDHHPQLGPVRAAA